jgi:ATP-dependent helicase/nuclease subunit B
VRTPIPPPNVRRHFLPWDRPLLGQAAEHLAAGWTGEGPLDLSGLLLVVPTRQSGRRVREALAELAAGRGRAVFPPRVVTPDALIAPPPPAAAASRVEALFAWCEVLRGIELAEFREVFPIDPPSRGFPWAIRVARQLTALQASLAEEGLGLASAATGTGGEFPESGRWRQLGELESRQRARLAAGGRTDPQAARITAAAEPGLPAGVGRVVILAVPDPLPLSLDVLGAFSKAVPVEVVVFAPEAEAASFDGWGRPLEPAWASRNLELRDFERNVTLCASPSAQADLIAGLASGIRGPDGILGVGVADPEVMPLLESALLRAGVASFNPAGRPRRGDRLYQLVSALAGLAREPSFAVVETLARCPDFLAYLASAAGTGFSVGRWLSGLDELHARHLPESLAAAQDMAAAPKGDPDLAAWLGIVAELRRSLTAEGFAAGGTRALERIFAARRLELDSDPDAQLEDSATAWMDVVRECSLAADLFPGVGGQDQWATALELFADGVRAEEKPDGALELQGWLELLFEDAPHLVVAGCNDGSLPGALTGDPFLPEQMRALLHLKGNGVRFARDAYMLQAVAACRLREGRIDILVGKVSGEGDPLRPSRLLFRCPDTELAGRVEYLFRPLAKARPSPSWTRAWRLDPAVVEGSFDSLPATAFREYLACPFRFYLRRALGISAFDPEKAELDGFDFGNLCHGALEAMGLERGLRNCTDAGTLRAFLIERLDASARERYGARLPVPLVIQLESARQRLSRAAEVQAGLRAEGWVIEQTERKYDVGVGGLVVTATIDRIDRHEKTGHRRVIDYKTSDVSVGPLKAHARVAKPGEAVPGFALFSSEGREMAWTDLQLPIYWEALRTQRGMAEAPSTEAGYFNLPKAVGETGLSVWSDYTPEIHTAAMRCAEGVAAAVEAGVFWPPAKDAKHDESNGFGGFFHHGAAESVEPGFAERVLRR